MPDATALFPLLPGLRRFASALLGSPKAPADDLVLRAIHQIQHDAPPEDAAHLRSALLAALAGLAQCEPLPEEAHPAEGLEKALLDLPVAHRAALVLINVENCSYAQAAQLLGISRNVLIGRLASARQMIARRMQADTQMTMPMRRQGAPFLRLVK